MKPVRIFRHAASEGPGYFASFLARHDWPFEIICIDAGAPVPEGLDDVAALVFMGGPMSVNDDLPWITQELDLIKRAAEIGMPMLGHCLGGQLIAKALGGTVTANAVKEIGWHAVRAASSDSARDWLGGLPDAFEVFHWHGETFSIPPGATPLLGNPWCENQAFASGNTLALQCHIEMTTEMVEEWVMQGGDELAQASPAIQNPESIRHQLPARIERLQTVAQILYTRWLRGLGTDGSGHR